MDAISKTYAHEGNCGNNRVIRIPSYGRVIKIPSFLHPALPPPTKELLLQRFIKSAARIGNRMAARQIVRIAETRNFLEFPQKLLCVDCGERAQCYDHRDYAKPLDVSAVCRKCNAWRGAALNP